MRTASRRLFALKLLPAQPADHFRRGRFLANDEAQPVAHPAVYRAIGDKGQSQALEAIEEGRVIITLQFSKLPRAGANVWGGS